MPLSITTKTWVAMLEFELFLPKFTKPQISSLLSQKVNPFLMDMASKLKEASFWFSDKLFNRSCKADNRSVEYPGSKFIDRKYDKSVDREGIDKMFPNNL